MRRNRIRNLIAGDLIDLLEANYVRPSNSMPEL